MGGHAVNAWAKDKVWLADHSVLLPSGDRSAVLFQNSLDTRRVSYVTDSQKSIPMITPAKFSVTMGAGESALAPHPYVAPHVVPEDDQLQFDGKGLPFDHYSATSSALDVGDFTDGVLTTGVGVLPVADVASASSAAAGVAPTLGLLADEGLSIFDADLTPWVSNTAGGASFGTATSMVNEFRGELDTITQENMQKLASAKIHGLIDGAYTDNLGLAQAIAAGANEVVTFMDANSTASGFTMEVLCDDGPNPTAPDAPKLPIFATSASAVRSAWQGFQRLDVGSSQFLKELVVGTFIATTMDNSYFDIYAGRDITIHVVQSCADVTIGQFENVNNYNAFTQEVIQAINFKNNSAIVENTLLPMFTGSSSIEI